MDPRQRRLAQNEALFREINERILEVAATHADDAHVYDFYCECSNAACTFRVPLRLRDYEAVRAHGSHFLVLPGHHLPEIETVIEQHPAWWVVEKHGEPARLVEELDPRR